MWQNFVIILSSLVLYYFIVSILWELSVHLYFLDMHNWLVRWTFNLQKFVIITYSILALTSWPYYKILSISVRHVIFLKQKSLLCLSYNLTCHYRHYSYVLANIYSFYNYTKDFKFNLFYKQNIYHMISFSSKWCLEYCRATQLTYVKV